MIIIIHQVPCHKIQTTLAEDILAWLSPDRTGLCRYYNGESLVWTSDLRKKAQID